jgi:hypothetical protein
LLQQVTAGKLPLDSLFVVAPSLYSITLRHWLSRYKLDSTVRTHLAFRLTISCWKFVVDNINLDDQLLVLAADSLFADLPGTVAKVPASFFANTLLFTRMLGREIPGITSFRAKLYSSERQPLAREAAAA